MFERFTDRSRKVMAYANWYAHATGSIHITANHIFAGLLIHDEGVAIETLKNLSLSIDQIRQWYELTHLKSDFSHIKIKLPTTSDAKDVVNYAIQFSRSSQHDWVGTEHLLIGWLSIQNDATDVFYKNSGVKLETVKSKVIEILPARSERKLNMWQKLARKLIGI